MQTMIDITVATRQEVFASQQDDKRRPVGHLRADCLGYSFQNDTFVAIGRANIKTLQSDAPSLELKVDDKGELGGVDVYFVATSENFAIMQGIAGELEQSALLDDGAYDVEVAEMMEENWSWFGAHDVEKAARAIIGAKINDDIFTEMMEDETTIAKAKERFATGSLDAPNVEGAAKLVAERYADHLNYLDTPPAKAGDHDTCF